MFGTQKNSTINVKSKDVKQRDIKHIRIEDVSTLYGIYEFKETIGHGSYGTVLAVVEKSTGTNYAIKVVNKFSGGTKALGDMQRELNVLKTVNHPNIIILHKVYESYKKYYMIFERCGDNLFNVFKKKYPFSEKIIKKIMKQLVGAVYYLHKNDIVHRDIKMENILLAKNPIDPNDEHFIKLVDFGLSIIKTGPGIKSMLTERCGTLIYMSPEILLQHNYSELCDVWSIGVILYVLLLGKFPFTAVKQEDVVNKILNYQPEIDRSIVCQEAEDLIKSILDKDPVTRITALEILKHPWLLDNKISSRKDETIIDYMKKWRSELILPGEESDWVGSYGEQSDYSIFPSSAATTSMGDKFSISTISSSHRSIGTTTSSALSKTPLGSLNSNSEKSKI